jgi:hypothetical protein
MRGVIDRRMLVNFRCEPASLARLVPAPFRPKLVQDWGMAGICLIRLKELRPRWLSTPLGFTSENAAHRIAVEWDQDGIRREGVFIPRRDTDSKLNTLAGGRLFPGIHHFARFDVLESPNRFKLEMRSEDGEVRVRVAARVADTWPTGSLFANLNEASAFFAAGSLGWSVGNRAGELDGLESAAHRLRRALLAVGRGVPARLHRAAGDGVGAGEEDRWTLTGRRGVGSWWWRPWRQWRQGAASRRRTPRSTRTRSRPGRPMRDASPRPCS